MNRRTFVVGLLLSAFLASCTAPAAAPAASSAGIQVTGAVVRMAGSSMPGMSMGADGSLAGFLTLKNTGPGDDALVGVTTDFALAMLHETSVDSTGVASMHEVESIAIPAGQTVMLEPGGYHLMFMNPTRALKPGDSVEIILRFKEAGAVTVQAQVTEP